MKRTISFLLACLLVLGVFPAHVHAEETEPVVMETTIAETVPAEETQVETTAVVETFAETIPAEAEMPETTLPVEAAEATEQAPQEQLETVPVLDASGVIASGSCGSNATWELSASSVLTVTGTGRISGGWKDYAEDIKTVTIKSGITGIGERAFENCKNMTRITIPSTVTSLGPYAFYNCESLTGITLPSGLTDLGYSTFYNCESLTSIKIPEGITEIGINTFYYCTNLKTVTLPSTIEHIKSSAFGHCYALTGITLYQGLTTLGGGAFMCCDSLKSVTLPNTLTSIPKDAFRQCESLTRVTIPSSVTSIGENAFTYTALTEVSIPASVTDIAEGAFSSCDTIKKFTVSTSNPSYCNDSYGVLYNKDKTVLLQAPTKLSGSYSVPRTVTEIDSWAFAGCEGLTSLTFPEGITELTEGVLARCKNLKSFTIPTTVIAIGRSAFGSCESLTELVIPDAVKTILYWTFSNCKSLKSIQLPEHLEKIEYGAFLNCEALTEITIPSTVKTIQYTVFGGCTALNTVTFLGDAPNLYQEAFLTVTATAYYPGDNATWTEDKLQNYGGTITWLPYSEEHVHKFDETSHQCKCGAYGGQCGEKVYWVLAEDGTLTIYGEGDMYEYSTMASQSPWVGSTNIQKVIIEDGVTSITSYAFLNCINLTSASIPEGIKSITYAAFKGCTSLKDITIPDGVSGIGTSAFSECAALTEISIPDSVTGIGSFAFAGCAGLTRISIPDGVTEFGEGIFQECSGLTSVSIPDSFTSIPPHTFAGCTGLTRLPAMHGVTALKGYAFASCAGLTDVVVPDSVTELGEGVFRKCIHLTSISLPDGLVSIGKYVFSSCENLTSIEIPGSVNCLDSEIFKNCSQLKSIVFKGNAPEFKRENWQAQWSTFSGVTATAYYPLNNPTWTADVMQNYGGTITWVPYCPGHEFAEATCTTPKTCSICGETEGEALGHDFQTGICARCGESQYHVTRISGKDRHDTAFKVANMLKSALNVEKFDTILIASGDDSADALAGSYLAAMKQAPILLSRNNSHPRNLAYIQENLSESGIVYILGGTGAVPQEMEDLLIQNGINYERVKGGDRFGTNIEILKKAGGIQGNEILVSTAYDFADSLSASATGKPILLVNSKRNTLNNAQKTYLAKITANGPKTFTIIGGTGAVSDELAAALSAYGTVNRVKGSGREATSVQVAETYFQNPDKVFLAYSKNFPDGLCGGPLAYVMDAPLLLVRAKYESPIAAYTEENGITNAHILGGAGAVPDEVARKAMNLPDDYVIEKLQ